MDDFGWEQRVPIFKNSLILKQLGIAIGIPFGVLIIFLIVIKAYFGLALVSLTLFVTFLLILSLYRGTYDIWYEMTMQGVTCHSQAKQKQQVERLAGLTFILGLLKGMPGVAGSGLLSASTTDTLITWRQVQTIRYRDKQFTVELHGGFGNNMVLFCTTENYSLVKQFITRLKGDGHLTNLINPNIKGTNQVQP